MPFLPSARAVRVLASAAVLVLSPAVAVAEGPLDPRAFCLPGSVGQCFAFAINDVATGFELWLRNLSPAADEVTNPFAIRQFAVARVNAPDVGGRRTDLGSGFSNANIAATDEALRGRAGFDENTTFAEFPEVRTFDYRAPATFGILGCGWPSRPLLDALGYVAVTCAERELGGWLRVAFGARVLTEVSPLGPLVSRVATRADVAVQVAGCTTHRGAASGVTGALPGSVLCDSTPFAESVVPEPSVVWLLGAGLAGAWAAARARGRSFGGRAARGGWSPG